MLKKYQTSTFLERLVFICLPLLLPHHRHHRILFLRRAHDESDARIFPLRGDFFVPGDRTDRDVVFLEREAAVPLVTLLDGIFEFDPHLPAGDVVFAFVADRDAVQGIIAFAFFQLPSFFTDTVQYFFEALMDFTLEDAPDEAVPLELLPFDVPPVLLPERFPFICFTT